MKVVKRFLFVAILSAFIFAGCSDDNKDLIADQEKEISSLKADLDQLEKAYNELEKIKTGWKKKRRNLKVIKIV